MVSFSYAIKSQNIVDRGRSAEPYVCIKCGEDVCQTWKKDVDTGAVVCEPCFMTCRSQAARLTHIENLKLGFADVLEKVEPISVIVVSVLPIYSGLFVVGARDGPSSRCRVE